MLHVMYIDSHHFFSMSMLSFIEDNKRNEHGGEFSRKLKIFQIFLHFFIEYSMHDLIFQHLNSNMIFSKTHEIEKHRVH